MRGSYRESEGTELGGGTRTRGERGGKQAERDRIAVPGEGQGSTLIQILGIIRAKASSSVAGSARD